MRKIRNLAAILMVVFFPVFQVPPRDRESRGRGMFGPKQGPTQTTRPDAQSQTYIDQMRRTGQGGADAALNNPGSFFAGPDQRSIGEQIQPYMNPYMESVIDPTRREFDRQRSMAGQRTNADAVQAGAFGGSRHGVTQGVRMGEIDRNEAGTIGSMLQQGYGQAMSTGLSHIEHNRQLQERQMQEPLFRHQQALNFQNMGMGPIGQTSTMEQPRNRFGGAMSGATAGAAFGPKGAIVGGVLGGLFG